jgi:hypothetical protein
MMHSNVKLQSEIIAVEKITTMLKDEEKLFIEFQQNEKQQLQESVLVTTNKLIDMIEKYQNLLVQHKTTSISNKEYDDDDSFLLQEKKHLRLTLSNLIKNLKHLEWKKEVNSNS